MAHKKYAHWTYYQSPIGWFSISGNGRSIAEVSFMQGEPTSFYEPVPDYLDNCVEQLEDYFSGKRQNFDVELDLQDATEFQIKVWNLLRQVPYGQTTSYTKIALELGDKKAIRAVGRAASQNPLLILIPCHRVIGLDGHLTGFQAGLETKEFLLNLERPQVYSKQTALF